MLQCLSTKAKKCMDSSTSEDWILKWLTCCCPMNKRFKHRKLLKLHVAHASEVNLRHLIQMDFFIIYSHWPARAHISFRLSAMNCSLISCTYLLIVRSTLCEMRFYWKVGIYSSDSFNILHPENLDQIRSSYCNFLDWYFFRYAYVSVTQKCKYLS